MEEPEPVKVVLLGESGVGKTCIISQFTTNKFNPRCATSVSAQFVSKTVEFPEYHKKIKFDIWDTVGQEKYRSLAKIFYKDAKVIVFVYDITTEFSFNALKDFWYKETLNYADNEPIFALVGNKIDLYQAQKVENKDAMAFADEMNAIFQTTSALSNSGITNLFEHLGKKIIIPNYDYKAGEREAKEKFLKKQNEEKEKGEEGTKHKKKGEKLKSDKNNKDGKNGKTKKSCC